MSVVVHNAIYHLAPSPAVVNLKTDSTGSITLVTRADTLNPPSYTITVIDENNNPNTSVTVYPNELIDGWLAGSDPVSIINFCIITYCIFI